MRKKLISRIGTLALATVVGLTSVGCGQQPAPAPESEPAATEAPAPEEKPEAVVPAKVTFKQEDFPNVLDVTATLDNVPYGYYETDRFNVFADMGAWHGYHLHELENLESYGGFAGPHIIGGDIGMNLSSCINRLNLEYEDGTKIDLSSARPYMAYYPGRLLQYYEDRGDYKVTLELIYTSGRTNYVRTKIENLDDEPITLKLSWDGEVYKDNIVYGDPYLTNASLKALDEGVEVAFKEYNDCWTTTDENRYAIRHNVPVKTRVSGGNRKYVSSYGEPVTLQPGESFTTYTAESYTFTKEEYDAEAKAVEALFADPDKAFEENRARWEGYLASTFDKATDVRKPYQNAAVKAMETMITNWRSASGAFKHSGLTPSMSYMWFNGVWAWDSWKIASGLAAFEPEVAKDGIRCLFDYQIQPDDEVRPQDVGMILDCFTQLENSGNYRNSKPPLSAWGVWNVYKATGDKAFLEEMYPKLVSYHSWWYNCRDNNRNGVIEYGSMVDNANYKKDENREIILDENGKPILRPEKVIEAAAWESGMDNATRFDQAGNGPDDIGVVVLENTNDKGELIGYSLNQESVDLNAMMYAEKGFLVEIANELGKTEDAAKYEEEAKFLADYINNNMWDEETGFYYDLQFNGDETKLLVNRGKGTEGWMPLWAKVAPADRAEKVKNNVMNDEMFNTRVPFPTASQDNDKFNPYRYWRGPVWLDQALYGVEALQNYGYEAEAREMAYKLFEGAEGLLSDGPIHENYNPITGERLHTSNFSWSSAAYYMLYRNALVECNPSTQNGLPMAE